MRNLYTSVKTKERLDHIRDGYENKDHNHNRHKIHMISKLIMFIIALGIVVAFFIL
jgi:hypothetical protein